MWMKNDEVKRSMDDVEKDNIIFYDAKGNKIGEAPRARKEESTIIEEDDSDKHRDKKAKSKKPKSKKSKKDKSLKAQKQDNIEKTPTYEERHKKANPKAKRRLSRKERLKRKRRAIAAFIIEVVLGLAILIIGSGLFVLYACGVEDVVVEGSTIYTDQEIEDYVLQGDYTNNCVYNVLHNFFKPRKDIPFVDNVKVTMTGLNTNKITVTERTPFGYATTNEGAVALYFDEDGRITDISDKMLSNVLVWQDVIPSGEAVGEKVVDDDVVLSSFLETARGLKANEVVLNSIRIDDGHNIFGQKNNIKINFGLKNDMDDKCKRLSIILPQIENQSGTLHLENFSPENTDIVFKKEE